VVATLLSNNRGVKKIFVIGLAIIIVIAAIAVTMYALYMQPQQGEKKEIVIGGTLSMTGSIALDGLLAKRGYDLALEKINREGGILGKSVRLLL